MMKKGFIVLSHQGLTMVGAIAEQLSQRGLVACVLSSRSARGLTPDWLDRVETTHITDGFSLTALDVNRFIESIGGDVQLIGCISVWDAYRDLMAEANRQIGARDVAPEIIRLLRDKLSFREELCRHGLSSKRARLVDESVLAALDDRSSFFVKPRTGLASFGTFRADQLANFDELRQIWSHSTSDRAYDGVFDTEPAFIIEGFIRGTEFSFEVSASQGHITVHAVHEKVDLTPMRRTVLENACVCPPVSIEEDELEAGVVLVRDALLRLGADEGIYHVEARYHHEDGWEIIEANPRIGGAYIVDSTRLHCGIDLIGRWIDLIECGRHVAEVEEKRKTFFRVFFGEPGRTIARLDRCGTGHPIVLDKLFVKAGERLPAAEREIFIGQALWDITSIPDEGLNAFINTSKAYLSVEYQP